MKGRTRGLATEQAAGIYRRNVGAIRIATLHDGMLSTSFEDVRSADPSWCESTHLAEYRSVPPQFSCNSFVVETSGALLLIDAGCGTHEPGAGKAAAALAQLGVRPEEIDAVLMTHMHQDHAGGLITPEGQAIYPNAELVLHHAELAFWQDEAILPRLRRSQHFDFDIANKAFGAYGDRIRTVKGDDDIRGITAVAVPGHTPGHVAWLLDSDGQRLAISGDIVHFAAFQFAHPEICVVYDIDSDTAAVSRQRFLNRVASEKLAIAGAHLDFPSYGHVERRVEGGFRYFAEVWTSHLG